MKKLFLLIIVLGCVIHWNFSTSEPIEAETASALITGECWYMSTPTSSAMVICEAKEVSPLMLTQLNRF